MEILTTTGYSVNNYGKWMNTIMEHSPSEWVLFHDHDIFFANKNWMQICQKHLRDNKDGGLFTCVTNRIGNGEQKVFREQDDHDLRHHWMFAEKQQGEPLIEATRPISGLIMLTSKTAWKKCGGFREKGIIGVDNHYYGAVKRAGYKVYIMKDLYVYHRYRAK